MKARNYIFITVIGAISILGIIFYNCNIIAGPEFLNEGNEGENIRLIVNYNNGSIKNIENIHVEPENNTVFDILLAFCEVEYTEYPGGAVFIDAIDGIENEAPNWWQYWVNDTYAPVGASHYHLSSNNEVKWVYGDS